MRKKMAYLLIIAGVLMLISGIVLLNNKTPDQQFAVIPTPITQIDSEAESKTNLNSSDKSEDEIRREKAMAFEKFVSTKIDKNVFRIVEWQGDKFHEGVYAENNLNPDFLIRRTDNKEKVALECKWRKSFYNDRVQWCTEEQLIRYKQFQKKNNTPVYVVIGIGGEPIQPSEVYVVPLYRMKFADATREYLQKFKHGNVDKLFNFELNH